MKKAAAIFLLLAVLFSFAACTPSEKTAMGFSMGSDYYVNYTHSSDLDREISALLSSIEESFSLQREDSLADRIRRAEKGEALLLTPVECEVLSRVFSIAEASEYAFDPALFPLVSAWGFDPPFAMNGEVPPSADKITEAREVSRCGDFALDTDSSVLRKEKSSAALDFGGAIKGYAAERVRDLLIEKKADSALVYIGGTIAAVGRSYEIGVTPPRDSEESYAMRFTLQKREICATSGDYERYYLLDGKRYHHIIDGSTGYPADSGIISATVICEDGLMADALATAVVVLGKEKGLLLLERCGAKGILITSDKKVVTIGVSVTIKDKSYEIF